MIKYALKKWDENNEVLRKKIDESNINHFTYEDLVDMTFDIIFNTNVDDNHYALDVDNITMIDNGDYQGTLLFMIPFDTYQPGPCQYFMTYVAYGSCSGCDTLQHIQNIDDIEHEKRVKEIMMLCKDLITNTIVPYNTGWRNIEDFETVTM